MTSMPVTATIAALLALFMLTLSALVSVRRFAMIQAGRSIDTATFSDCDDEHLRRRIRAFGNFIEYVPVCLLLLALCEWHGASAGLLWILGLALLAGRVCHAVGMLVSTSSTARAIGMLLTYPSLLIPALWLLFVR